MSWFHKALPAAVRSSGFPAEYGYPNEHYVIPNEMDIHVAEHPVNADNHLSLGVENRDPIAWADYQGMSPDLALAPVPVSTLGRPGSPRLLVASGPVTGTGSVSTGRNQPLVAPSPGYAGPVVGGMDYAQAVANAYYAAQATAYSQQAANEAMVSAL